MGLLQATLWNIRLLTDERQRLPLKMSSTLLGMPIELQLEPWVSFTDYVSLYSHISFLDSVEFWQ